MAEKKLFLLDAFALIYRAYFAFSRNPMVNSKGFNVSAATGFTNYLVDLIKKENPTHIAVVFDAPGGTERAAEFEFYKANREAMPEDIASNLPYIKAIIDAFNIPRVELAGYEADDIIGTIAKRREKEGYTVYMVTPDKDYAQLVSENIFMYKPGRSGKPAELIGLEEVKEQWNVERPEQVIDILGMWGDAVDNIPGIPGIGEKTAKKLVAQYGSMEGLFEHVDELKGKQKENVTNFMEQGLISKQLATIILDVPIGIEDEQLIMSEPDKDKLKDLFIELEFRTIGRKILGADFNINQSSGNGQMDLFAPAGAENTTSIGAQIPEPEELGKDLSNTDHNYQLVEDEAGIKTLLTTLEQHDVVVFDTETTGLNFDTMELVGLSFAVKPHEAYYVPMPEDRAACIERLAHFKGLFAHERITKVAHNIKFDLRVLGLYDIPLSGPMFDTMLAHYILEPDKRHKMDYLAESYLGYTPMPIEALIGKKGKNQLTMRDVPLDKQCEYAAEDADITLQLYQVFAPKIIENDAAKLMNEVELPLIPVLAAMENEGVNLDEDYLAEYSTELESTLQELKQSVFTTAGVDFNLDSPKQLGQVLFEKMEIPYKGKKTKTGQFSTNEETLSKLREEHPIVESILEYREITKLKSTYVDALPREVSNRTQRIHTTFQQTIASTGRLSSIGPNLQNIPIRTERGRKVREAFIPRDEQHVLLAADYSQIELRLIADFAKEKNMLEAFKSGLDIHSATAAGVYGTDMEGVTSEMRRKAKMVNFGIIYGISAFGLSQRLGVPRKEAAELIENYFKQYPGIKTYMEDTVENAKSTGYVETILGRRRYLKDINSRNHTVRSFAEREAINAPIQGSAADMIKVAMIRIHDIFKKEGFRSKMTLQVHDELVFDAHKEELDTIQPIIIKEMRDAIPLTVPIEVEAGVGKHWLEAH